EETEARMAQIGRADHCGTVSRQFRAREEARWKLLDAVEGVDREIAIIDGQIAQLRREAQAAPSSPPLFPRPPRSLRQAMREAVQEIPGIAADIEEERRRLRAEDQLKNLERTKELAVRGRSDLQRRADRLQQKMDRLDREYQRMGCAPGALLPRRR
ncbi:MAG: hypothetical protein MI723_11650, partial [Caulobacterales bacterium]|nr:hypothetical protein [Caulobacterales bacterium]